ncbi:RNA polymerase Rpb3/Rpb11 dimerization domain-containing protein [Gorgonomyces haynaldii]|nr:RNA polymerase Rpb3/Rpb11 dimerization domain-containing protein [Gorgonomyces haynaldii]
MATSIQVIHQDEAGGSATFKIENQDHTMGNILRYMLLQNPAVSYCGYAISHPSERFVNLRVQTDLSVTPEEAVNQALDNLSALFQSIKSKLITS